MRTTSLLALMVLATMLACALGILPAQAQPARVFVAAQGSDANACTFAAPCRTFQHAHDVVAAGGEIDVLDPAGYGVLTINKAISIQGHGFAGISAPGAAAKAIVINAGASDKINLRALLIDGVGTGQYGIVFNSGASLNVQDSLIRNFTGGAIRFVPSASSQLFVSDTVVTDNAGDGFTIAPSGSGSVSVVLERVESDNNAADGIYVDGSGTTGPINATISESVFAKNAVHGIEANSSSPSAGGINVMVRACSVTGSGVRGVLASQVGVTVRVTRSTITGNAVGWAAASSGTLLSYGDNNVDGNTTDGTPSGTIPAK